MKSFSKAGLAVTAATLLMSGIASADELKILDSSGKTRSVADLNSGAAATVKVTTTTIAKDAVATVNLTSPSTSQVIQSTKAEGGIATFKNVTSGTYSLSAVPSSETFATVEIIPNTPSDQGNANEGKTSESIYVAGASAVAGVLGVSLANSGGSDGGAAGGTAATADSIRNQVTGAVPTLNPDGSADNTFMTSQGLGFTDTPPNPGAPSAAPTPTPAPPFDDPFGGNFGGSQFAIPTPSPAPSVIPTPAPPFPPSGS